MLTNTTMDQHTIIQTIKTTLLLKLLQEYKQHLRSLLKLRSLSRISYFDLSLQFNFNFLHCLRSIDVLRANRHCRNFSCILLCHKQMLLFREKNELLMNTFHENRHEKKLIKTESPDMLESALNCVAFTVLGVSTVLQFMCQQ